MAFATVTFGATFAGVELTAFLIAVMARYHTAISERGTGTSFPEGGRARPKTFLNGMDDMVAHGCRYVIQNATLANDVQLHATAGLPYYRDMTSSTESSPLALATLDEGHASGVGFLYGFDLEIRNCQTNAITQKCFVPFAWIEAKLSMLAMTLHTETL